MRLRDAERLDAWRQLQQTDAAAPCEPLLDAVDEDGMLAEASDEALKALCSERTDLTRTSSSR
jgi:hypothetical protein